jgi:hypothetical protein
MTGDLIPSLSSHPASNWLGSRSRQCHALRWSVLAAHKAKTTIQGSCYLARRYWSKNATTRFSYSAGRAR